MSEKDYKLQDAGFEFDWDSEIENDGPEYTTLPEGDYDFEVVNFERGRHSPKEGGKLPACNKATVSIRIKTDQGETTIPHSLFLHSQTEGLLCAFFTAIGQRKKGEKLKMNWNAVIGARGRCKIGIRKYRKDDEERTINEIKRFYEPDEGTRTQPQSYTPGKF